MATWHQMKGQRRARKAGRPINFQHETGWTVVIDPPNEMRSAITFSDKAEAERYQKKFKHTYIIPPANNLTSNPRKRRAKKSAKRRTVKRGKHLTAKRRVIKRETLRRNPTRRCIIEALTLNGYTPKYFYWTDAEQKFTSKREHASPYSTDKAARIEAKKLMRRLPKAVRSLRVVPQ